jgi:hypothetical protein
MLETTLSTEFIPGTNVKGDVAGANWSFLLPELELDRVLCIGLPAPATFKTLTRLSREVIILCKHPRHVRELCEKGEKVDSSQVYPIVMNARLKRMPLPSGTINLVLIGKEWNALRIGREQELLAEIERVLKSDGSIYFEFGDPFERFSTGREKLNGSLGESFSRQVFWLTPLHGEMRTAVPRQDKKTIDYLVRHYLFSSTSDVRLLARAERYVIKHPWSGRLLRRSGVLLTRSTSDLSGKPPHYLRSAAEAAGIDLSQSRWALLAQGKFSSRKVLFLLFEKDSETPHYIVKLTRDPVFNYRLENEYKALALLWEKGVGDQERLPQSIFCSHPGNLMLVGQTIIQGKPFRRQHQSSPEHPLGRDACAWLSKLGEFTADPTIASPAQVAKALRQLFVRFLNIYRLTPEQSTFIEGQIDSISQTRNVFPLVFQHGDPGTWNLMVTRSGKVAFLDWEAAEPHGIPLWDLFYFLRSYCIWATRGGSRRDSLQVFAQGFLGEAPLNLFVSEMIHNYCQRLGLPDDLIQPLFYTCWMHRALKESTRLPQAKLERGHYVNLLRTSIDQSNAPGLRRLFVNQDTGKL